MIIFETEIPSASAAIAYENNGLSAERPVEDSTIYCW